MYMCMKINYINSPLIKLKVMASFCSHYFISLAGLLRRTTGISGPWASICTILFPNLSNRNQSLPEPWRHARVQAIRCTHHIGEKIPPA